MLVLLTGNNGQWMFGWTTRQDLVCFETVIVMCVAPGPASPAPWDDLRQM